RRTSVRAEPRRGVHAFRGGTAGGDDRLTFASFGFYYDESAANRVCEPAVRGIISQKLKDTDVWAAWAMIDHDPPETVDAYPVGSRVAVAMWNWIKWSEIVRHNPSQQPSLRRTASN